MTERGHFEAGKWIPERVIVHAWRYGKADDIVCESPQEAWAMSYDTDGQAYVDYIKIDERKIYFGFEARDHGGMEETVRIMKEEYGVDTSGYVW